MAMRISPSILKSRASLRIAGLVVSWVAIGAANVRAADSAHPVVVELFQSQGCSSCPPANANVNALSERADVLARSFAITYWDNLGWKDTFAKDQFTDRQWRYAHAMHRDNVYTPQIVVNGRAEGVGAERNEIEALIHRADRSGGPAIAIRDGSAEIGASQAPAQGADVWLVRYDPRVIEVSVRRGENAGKTLPHKNIVRELARLGGWSGEAEHFALPAGDPALSTAILVQTSGAGPILAAAKE
jgi:hypothetical protein